VTQSPPEIIDAPRLAEVARIEPSTRIAPPDGKRLTPLSALCRLYQSLFRMGHPQFAEFRRLYQQDREAYHRGYFNYEFEAGCETLQNVTSAIESPERAFALDFGCGVGGATAAYASEFGRVIGIDINREGIEAGRELLATRDLDNAELLQYDGRTLPFEDGSIDVVLSKDVIEHCADPQRALSEVSRVLKPGGLLHLDFGPLWYHAHGKHCWDYLPGWWTHLLFSRRVIMRTLGLPPETNWMDLELNRMSVRRFRRLMRTMPLESVHVEECSNRWVRPIAFVPLLRELVISRVVGSWRKK